MPQEHPSRLSNIMHSEAWWQDHTKLNLHYKSITGVGGVGFPLSKQGRERGGKMEKQGNTEERDHMCYRQKNLMLRSDSPLQLFWSWSSVMVIGWPLTNDRPPPNPRSMKVTELPQRASAFMHSGVVCKCDIVKCNITTDCKNANCNLVKCDIAKWHWRVLPSLHYATLAGKIFCLVLTHAPTRGR